MNKELDDLLSQRYAKIFVNRNRPVQESAMGWGITCGDGWFDLLDTLCACLQDHTDNNDGPQVVAMQIKEKWGALRFYEEHADEKQLGMIEMAVAFSAHLCEQCGKPGQLLRQARTYLTRCPEHASNNLTPNNSIPV